jgi:hypothetical protein
MAGGGKFRVNAAQVRTLQFSMGLSGKRNSDKNERMVGWRDYTTSQGRLKIA